MTVQSFEDSVSEQVDGRGFMKDGREYYAEPWSCKVSFSNLMSAGKILGQDNIVRISMESQDVAIPFAVHTLMSVENTDLATALIENFVCSLRLDGSKIAPNNLDEVFEGDIAQVVEAFVIILQLNYKSFFTRVTNVENSPVV